MKDFYMQEDNCVQVFNKLGTCYHLWTPENFPLIFTCAEDFQISICILGLCKILFPGITLLTFEIMSNHIHILACGELSSILLFFETFKKYLIKYARFKGYQIDWTSFEISSRQLLDIKDVRNVIIYDNRNGSVVNLEYNPYTYPWGANKYYFNPDAVNLARQKAEKLTRRLRRTATRSHDFDNLDSSLWVCDNYVCPASFCRVDIGEKLFRNAGHYFNALSRSVESNKSIASEIGEQFFYTDDELYSVLCSHALKRYSVKNPSQVPPDGKIELAKIMHYEYHSSSKQICRILKIPLDYLSALNL